MTQYYGMVNKDGQPVDGAGTSNNWQSSLREQRGLFQVTLNGPAGPPVPVLTPNADDLETYGQGLNLTINVTDIGVDEHGRAYFGVALNQTNGNLAPNDGFSFFAIA